MPDSQTILTLGVAAAQVFDWISTRIVLDRGGREMNPVAAKGMDLLGVDGYLCAKGVAVTGATWWVAGQSHGIALAVLLWYAYWMHHNWKQL